MDSDKIIEGEFYLKENVKNRKQGYLTIKPDNSSQLRIFGSFDTPSPARNRNSYTIFAQAFDGQRISMLGCSVVQKRTTYGELETES